MGDGLVFFSAEYRVLVMPVSALGHTCVYEHNTLIGHDIFHYPVCPSYIPGSHLTAV